MNRRQRTAAADLFLSWRAQGVPSLVTGHEAWRLSDGLAGAEGDHADAWPLMRVATRMATRPRPCLACGHSHDPASPGDCGDARCLPGCPACRA